MSLNYRDQIIDLRLKGLSYSKIAEILKCSKSTALYHCSDIERTKSAERTKRNRKKKHPLAIKIESFSRVSRDNNSKKKLTLSSKSTITQLLYYKIKTFHREYKSMQYFKPSFSVEDVMQKFGEHPICYLTGEPIDIYKTNTYHFDHIIPRSRGGTNDIDNLAICTSHANKAKGNMTPDELINLCKKIVKHHESK